MDRYELVRYGKVERYDNPLRTVVLRDASHLRPDEYPQRSNHGDAELKLEKVSQGS